MTTRISSPILFSVLCAGSISLTACAAGAGPDPRPGHMNFRQASVLTAPEIYASGAATALQALERLRPLLLISKIDVAPFTEREVYLDGVRLGGINELRLIPANAVQEIRFVRAIHGGGTGSGREGAILVISKAGR